jgi:cytochrome P450
MQPAFHQSKITEYSVVIQACAEEALSRWRDGDVLDMAVEMNRLTLEIICRTMFGSSAQEYAAEVGHLLEIILPMLNRLVMPLGAIRLRLPLPSTRAYFRALRRLDEILSQLTSKGSGGSDLLGMLLDARYEDGSGLSARELRDQIITIFVAGHETTGNGLAWILYLVSRRPDIWARMRSDEELVKAVAQEGMRLYPPVWIMGRRALQTITVGSLEVPKDTVVLMSQYSLHRRPALYQDPLEFRPERWLDATPPRWGHLPFGAGPRVCIGERFATQETTIILSEMAERFALSPEYGHVKPGAYLTLRPKPGVRIKVRAI